MFGLSYFIDMQVKTNMTFKVFKEFFGLYCLVMFVYVFHVFAKYN